MIMKKPTERTPPLEDGLRRAMQALDNQIEKETARRTPAELEDRGVQKWAPYTARIERVCSFALNCLGDEEIKLDSILVLAQAFVKTLKIAASDLGEEGLGKLRTAYCIEALDKVRRDADAGLQSLRANREVM